MEPSPKVVEAVIDEYDIIDDPESQTTQRYDLNRPSDPPMQDSVTADVDDADGGEQSANERISNIKRLPSSDDHEPLVKCPRVNCPEKIVFCIDASAEMDKFTFRSRSGDKYSPKQMAKKGLGIFLQSKLRIDKKHEYALLLLQESAVWVRDFTNNPRDIQVALEDVVDTHVCETCDVGSVFEKIMEKVAIPRVEGDPTWIPPPYVIRVIFIYCRSNCPLQFEKREAFNLFNSSPYFFLDAVYLHEPPSEDNQCQAVFDSICDLDHHGSSYIVGASRNPTKFYDHMAQLLAHPLQRPVQTEAAYRIGSPVPEND